MQYSSDTLILCPIFRILFVFETFSKPLSYRPIKFRFALFTPNFCNFHMKTNSDKSRTIVQSITVRLTTTKRKLAVKLLLCTRNSLPLLFFPSIVCFSTKTPFVQNALNPSVVFHTTAQVINIINAFPGARNND